MDSMSTMLWNFEEGISESDSLGTSSAGSETDPLSTLLTSMARVPQPQQQQQLSNSSGGVLATTTTGTGICDSSNMLACLGSNTSAGGGSGKTAVTALEDGRGQGNDDSGVRRWQPITPSAFRDVQPPRDITNNSSGFESGIGSIDHHTICVKCPICADSFRHPKVLACFHSFCKCCLERQLLDHNSNGRDGGGNDSPPIGASQMIVCPLCHVETQLSAQLGIDGLLSDYALEKVVMFAQQEQQQQLGGRSASIKKKKNSNSINNNDDNKSVTGMLIFGSPSSTSSSPPLTKVTATVAVDENQNDADVCAVSGSTSAALLPPPRSAGAPAPTCTGCKSGETASAYCCQCAYYLCANCTLAHRYMHCFDGHRVEELLMAGSGKAGSGTSSGIASGTASASGGDSSSGTSPPNTSAANTNFGDVLNEAGRKADICNSNNNDSSSHCKCLEHRSQPLRFFCITCNLAICRDCTTSAHTSPAHNVETIDNVAEKQIGMMEALIDEARNKQSELHEIFRLIDADQNRLNASFQQAQANVDESADCLLQLVQEARKTMSKELENAFGYKQLQLTIIDKEVQKMTKKMSQTIEFTQRLLKYSSPTEVMVFKPLLDSRLQGFLNFNADTNNFLHTSSCEIDTQPLNVTQARQTIFSLMSNIQSSAAAALAALGDLTAIQHQQQQSQSGTAASATSTHLPSSQWPPPLPPSSQQHSQNNRIGSASPTSMLLYHHQQQRLLQQNHHHHLPTDATANHRHQSFSGAFCGNVHHGAGSGLARSVSPAVVASHSLAGGAARSFHDELLASLGAGGHNGGSGFMTASDTQLTNDFDFGAAIEAEVSAAKRIPIRSDVSQQHLGVGGPIGGASAPVSSASFLAQSLGGGGGSVSPTSMLASIVHGGNGGGSSIAANTVFNQYEKWSSGLDPSSLGALSLSDPDTITDLSILAAAAAANNNNGNANSNNLTTGGNGAVAGSLPSGISAAAAAAAAAAFQQLYPPRSQIKRQKMTYHCKFGEFGVMEGQFTEPSGVAVNAQNDIVVADTNNHRIQVFDKEGRFKFQFGECGKRDGQLLYPNRVSVNRVTGDFIVTERSPTHQIQIYNQYGQFLRKFGANILQHPRGVCVDGQGRIIVVECKVMRVIIFDAYGNIIQKFSCSRYLEFPNGVCTNDKNEILISDNRAHCIKVFDYEGHYVRQIGGEGVTNYPIGVGINSAGEVVVADNHNNFNLTVFAQDGTMLNALESKVKHAQCFDVALVEDGSVVLASKDYRLYLYRYQTGAGCQLTSSSGGPSGSPPFGAGMDASKQQLDL